MKVVAIIQARMSSARLPQKVLANIHGKLLLHHTVERTKRCALLDDVIVATGDQSADDPIAEFCAAENVPCFRGDPDDVLTRYVDAAQFTSADAIVRLTADCPLLDPEVMALVVQTFLDGSYDYTSNMIERTYPHGLDVEVFTRDALDRMDREAHLPEEREHMTRYIQEHPEIFSIGSVKHTEDLSHYRWVVDEPEDLTYVRTVFDHFGHNRFTWLDLLDAAKANPAWQEINRHAAEIHVYT